MTLDKPFDVAVVGGGACGLSVLVQMIEKASKSMRLAILEKSDVIGPGLAYSDTCRGARINTHATHMGMRASDPGAFAKWMEKNPADDCGGSDYPYRSHYGKYLQAEMDRVTKLAQEKDIELNIYKKEVVDIEQHSSGYTIHMADGRSIETVKAVLAPGNHIRQLNKHLDGKEFYFGRPWPSSRLLDIPKNASVGILGSRLTAIDEAVFLAKRGHTGPIYLFSRSGQLPKVQGGSKKYKRAYTLYNLAREVEDSPDYAMLKVADHLHSEIKSITSGEVEQKEAEASEEDGLIPKFRCDVEMAQKDEVPIFRVLTETGPMSERYWNCLSNRTKESFLDNYMSTWISYRAAMPLTTGEKLLELLESGQVRVVRTDGKKKISHSDPGFDIPVLSSEKNIQVDALVEATGMEFDITRIETKLMQNLVSRKLLKPHVAGGVDVGFRTLQAQKDLYCLGSLTRGIHFHTTTLDRSVVHAEWIADDCLGLPPRKFLHIALFAGRDLFSQLIVGRLVPRLLGAGHVPFIYLPTPESGKRRPSFSTRELEFYETKLLQDTVVPHLGKKTSDIGPCSTLKQLRERFGILIESVSDVNDTSFVRSLEANHIDVGYSIRSPQRFGEEIARYFTSHQSLTGMQARSPKTRGDKEANYYLKEVVADGSTTLANITTHTINYPTVMEKKADFMWKDVIDMMFEHAEEIARGYKPSSSFYDDGTDGRNTGAAEGDLPMFKTQGLQSTDKEAIKKILVKAFSPADDSEKLQQAIENASRAYHERSISQELGKILTARASYEKHRGRRSRPAGQASLASQVK